MSEQELFIEAMNRQDPEERRRFLDEACGGDPALRKRLDKLIQHTDDVGSFLESPPSDFAIPTICQPVTERPGDVIGPYKLLQQIGEGGMGVVYMAEQTTPVERRVALKIIKPGMDTQQVIARFEAERQALAMMDHPNIARVLDAGTTATGRPYFVMELVKGLAITEYCDEQHLSPRERLELFVPICQAVQHAHQKGIIHRDLKPSNILVARYDDKPVPKVIDFGVAKATSQKLTERTMFTQYGQLVGTIDYMSPEQAQFNQLDVDTRSDIYSLGVLLYELLTGETPFDRTRLRTAAFEELLRIIREEEPPRPSVRLSSCETLASVAANRHMEPHKLGPLVQGELDWIVMKALEKDRNRRYETANGFAADVQRYLNDEPVQACPPSVGYRLRKFARRNKGSVAIAGLVLFFLVVLGSGVGWAVRDRAAREADVVRQQAERQAKLAARVELILADVDRWMKDQRWNEALAAARRADAAVVGGEADEPTIERVHLLVMDLEFIDRLQEIRMQLAAIVETPRAGTAVEGEFDSVRADREYARAFREYGVDIEALAVETSIDRLKARPALAIPLATALDDWIYARRKVSEEDATSWKPLVTIARSIDPEPLRDTLRATWGRPVSDVQDELLRLAESVEIHSHQPETIVSLARTLLGVGNSDFAVRLLRDAQRAYPGDFCLNFELAAALAGQKEHEGAVRFYTAAVSIRPNAIAALNNLGNALRQQEKLDEAIAVYRKAIELDPKYVAVQSNLGTVLWIQGKKPEAIAAFRKAIELDPHYATPYTGLGHTLFGQGELDAAISAYRKALEVDPDYVPAYAGLGETLKKQGKSDEAIAAFRKAVELDPKDGTTSWLAPMKLALVLLDQNRFSEAIAAYRIGMEYAPDNHRCYNDLAWLFVTCPDPEFHNPGEALVLARKALELTTARSRGSVLNTLGVALYRTGDWKGAVVALTESSQLRQGGDSLDWFFLAMAHWQLNNKEEARHWYAKAAEWMEKNSPTNKKLILFRTEAAELLGVKEKQD